jgi:hypothetical protein
LYINPSEDRIRLIINSVGGTISYDTEGYDRRDITINGHEGIIYTKGREMQIVWLDKENSAFYFLHCSDLDELDFWKVANYWASKRIKMGEDYE